MKRLLRLSILGGVIQACSLYLFVQAGRSDSAVIVKPVIMVAFVAGMVLILWPVVRSSRFTRMVLFCCGQAAAGVIAMQSFALFAYPGLAKDVEFMSLANVELVCRQALMIILVYSGLVLLLAIFNRVLVRLQ